MHLDHRRVLTFAGQAETRRIEVEQNRQPAGPPALDSRSGILAGAACCGKSRVRLRSPPIPGHGLARLHLRGSVSAVRRSSSSPPWTRATRPASPAFRSFGMRPDLSGEVGRFRQFPSGVRRRWVRRRATLNRTQFSFLPKLPFENGGFSNSVSFGRAAGNGFSKTGDPKRGVWGMREGNRLALCHSPKLGSWS